MSRVGKQWIELAQKRDVLEGTRILRTTKHLAVSHYVLSRNFQDLMGLINSYEKNWEIFSISKRQQLDDLLKEFTRLLHNYLASVLSLIEHTRGFRQRLGNKELNDFCDSEIIKLQSNQKFILVQELRAYTQHAQLPLASATFSFVSEHQDGQGTFTQKLILDKAVLLESDRWSKNSKAIIEQTEKGLDVKEVVQHYQTFVEQFYNSIYDTVTMLYLKEFQELLELERKLFELQQEEKK